jgi:hypothetical protein
MIDYGSGPQPDEIEITIFGPGFGEAIAVHLGDGQWLLVDSCIDPHANAPASGTYLDQIGVAPDQVRAIVASHWHDDHVRGISMLASKYSQADFIISGVLNEKEASAFLAAYGGASAGSLVKGAKELYSVVDMRDNVYAVMQRANVLEATINQQNIRVTALSPSCAAFAQSIAHFAEYLPKQGQPITHAPELRPNLEAVVIHIDFGDDAILLGSDLEDDDRLGWSAICADRWCQARSKATVYKVAHHGSSTGDHPQVWTAFLKPNPVACLTPFIWGRHNLPTSADRERIKKNADQSFITSGATRRPKMDNQLLKRLGDICKNVSRVNADFGAVRVRKVYTDKSWSTELFGRAQDL